MEKKKKVTLCRRRREQFPFPPPSDPRSTHTHFLHIDVALGIFLHLVATELLLKLVGHEALVVLEVLLDVHLELDRVVQHLLDLRMQLLAQRVRPECQLLVSVER